VAGRNYPTSSGQKRATCVIDPTAPGYLSFTNLVEAYMLTAMRREYQLKLDRIRKAVRYVQKKLGVEHPLARQVFKTDGVELFVDNLGALLNVSREGQLTIREAFEAQLERIEYKDGLAARLFPRMREGLVEQPRFVVIDPRIGFGRPVLAEAGVPISVVKQRFRGGDSFQALAEDFGVGVDQIEEALRAA
jgi:uncharacterized protein (DUF433 family)